MERESDQTIVVVDDDLELNDLITAFFRPKGFKVVCFENPLEALEKSLSTGQTWDILLTDYHFKGISGLDFCHQIKLNLPDLPIVLMSPHLQVTQNIQKPTDNATNSQDIHCQINKHVYFRKIQIAVNQALAARSFDLDKTDVANTIDENGNSSFSLIGKSPKFLAAAELASRASKSNASILLIGESGTGKEVIAKFIHQNSKRCNGPFTAINCSSIPENLLESELFGHAKGAFTGAVEKRVGIFEAAENGTLFLDEIGDLSLALQAKLLRVLQEKKIKRVGENQERAVNCRIVAATHKNLEAEIQAGRFREDLFYRINVIPIAIPPLRERPDDVLPLAEFFLLDFARENESGANHFSLEAIEYLVKNKWKGNVRELENSVERAVVLCAGDEVSLDGFLQSQSTNPSSETEILKSSSSESLENTFSVNHSEHLPSLEEVINKYIAYAIQKNGGARDKAAKEIGIDRKTLYRRMHVDVSNPVQ